MQSWSPWSLQASECELRVVILGFDEGSNRTLITFLILFNVCVQAAEDEEEPEGRGSSEEESSDDDKSWVEEVREQRRLLRQEDRDRRRQERKEADRNTVLLERERNGGEKTSNASESKKPSQPQFYQIKPGEEFRSFNDIARKQKLQKYVLNWTVKLSAGLLSGTLFEIQVMIQIALGFAAAEADWNRRDFVVHNIHCHAITNI